MYREVKVHLLPALFEPEDVRGGIAVIIDVLRASTTIVHALDNGAKCVIPCGEVDEAHRIARTRPAGSVLLGGEREGTLIDGFDLDNNPFAYTASVVQGKTIAFTTSNGTRALLRAAAADRVLIGSFVNLQAVVNVLASDPRPVHLVCAGTKGKITVEDSLCAGAIVDRVLSATGADEATWTDDQLRLALDLYRRETVTAETFRRAMRSGYGGRNCVRLGFDDQIERAATFDLFAIVPEYTAATKTIQ
ncbi:MAG: 2-phosphosulfolactate phosphatase [Planctomycetes bacterium]|nr:2-phosphosulfolactate phosphatase [Planctomycetota bacterium]